MASLIANNNDPARLYGLSRTQLGDSELLFHFDEERRQAGQTAFSYLQSGLESLFAVEHGYMIDISIQFLVDRIGAGRFLTDVSG